MNIYEDGVRREACWARPVMRGQTVVACDDVRPWAANDSCSKRASHDAARASHDGVIGLVPLNGSVPMASHDKLGFTAASDASSHLTSDDVLLAWVGNRVTRVSVQQNMHYKLYQSSSHPRQHHAPSCLQGS